jgi:hypothetical protein
MAQGRKIYRTARGKQVDLDLLISRNELTPAVGNAKVNARGDELGPGGKIIRKREDVLKDYYNAQPGMRSEVVVKETPLTQSEAEEFEEFDAEPVVEKPAPKPKATTTKTKTEAKSEEPEWIEDEDGNFIRKGE